MSTIEALRFGGKDWAGVKRRLANHYAQLTEEDLAYAPGGEDALFKRLTARTMDSRENIERFLREDCGLQLVANCREHETAESVAPVGAVALNRPGR